TPSNRCLRFGPRVAATPARLAPVLPARLWTDQTCTGKLTPASLSHPAPGSCLRSNVTGVRGLATHAVPIRRQATPVTCLIRHGVRSMHCHLPSLQPGPFPPPPPPPFITGLFGRFIGVGSEEARLIALALASVRRSVGSRTGAPV